MVALILQTKHTPEFTARCALQPLANASALLKTRSARFLPRLDLSSLENFGPELLRVSSHVYQHRFLQMITQILALGEIYQMHFFQISQTSN